MKVSVVMTTYNGEKYVIEQLDSLKNQVRQIDELFILDDGSKDETVNMVSKYIRDNQLGDKWKLIINPVNLGYANNFKKGIGMCSGDYIFFSDQDDIWNTDKISSVIKIMDLDDKIKVLCSDYEPYYFTDDAPVISKAVTDRMKGDYSVEKVNFDTHNIYIRSEGCCMAIKKSFWEEIKNYWCNGWAHDEFIWEMALCADGLYEFHSPTLKRRLHSNNVSKKKERDLKKRIDFQKNLVLHYKRVYKFSKEKNLSKDKLKVIEKTIKCNGLRADMMEKRRILNIIPLTFCYSKNYYSIKSIPVELFMSLKRSNYEKETT